MTAYLIKGFYGNLPVILMSVTVILLAGILIYVLVRLHREYDMLDKMLDSAIEEISRKKDLMNLCSPGWKANYINFYHPVLWEGKRWRRKEGRWKSS